MCRIVNWQGVLESAFERGVRLHIQLAPGSVLANLGKRVMPEAINIAYQCNKLSTLHKLMEEEQVHQ
jgi:malonate decarboxylase epsilon subunit